MPSELHPDLVRRTSAGPYVAPEENDRDGASLPEIHASDAGVHVLRAKLAVRLHASTLTGSTWPSKDLVRALAPEVWYVRPPVIRRHLRGSPPTSRYSRTAARADRSRWCCHSDRYEKRAANYTPDKFRERAPEEVQRPIGERDRERTEFYRWVYQLPEGGRRGASAGRSARGGAAPPDQAGPASSVSSDSQR